MVSYSDERPNWVKANDPFFAMFRKKCTNRSVWLLRTLPTKAPTKEGKPISVLEFFLSMDEENFWSVIDRCPDCTSYAVFDAYRRHAQRKASQLANMANQEEDLGIDMLFECSLKNQLRLSNNRKLILEGRVEGPLPELRRSKRTKFLYKKNKIRITVYVFN